MLQKTQVMSKCKRHYKAVIISPTHSSRCLIFFSVLLLKLMKNEWISLSSVAISQHEELAMVLSGRSKGFKVKNNFWAKDFLLILQIVPHEFQHTILGKKVFQDPQFIWYFSLQPVFHLFCREQNNANNFIASIAAQYSSTCTDRYILRYIINRCWRRRRKAKVDVVLSHYTACVISSDTVAKMHFNSQVSVYFLADNPGSDI